MTRKQLWNMKSALPRTTFLAIGIAAASLFTTPLAFGGQKEIDAINQALAAQTPPGGSIETATEAALTAAVLTAIDDPANKKLSPTTLAGEALKGAGDPDFGGFFGVQAAASNSPRITDKNKFAAGAAVSASTGKTADATQVPAFASAFFSTNDAAQQVARLATKSNTAIGAILGGRSLEVTTEAERINLANTALQDGKTAKAAQQIAQFVSAPSDVDDNEAAAFATAVAVANKKYLQKVAVGTTTSNPNSAGRTIELLIDSSISADVIKKAPALAKSVGLVADIEQVQLMAVELGKVVTAKTINSTAKALIQAISGRAPASTGNDRMVNKADEVGEVAAYYLAALKDNPLAASKFASAKAAANFAFALAKTMFKAAKVKNIKGTQVPTALQAELLVKDGNFGASLALTFKDLGLAQDIIDAIEAKLTDPKSLKAIAGKTFAADLGAAFQAGFDADPNVTTHGFENGTDFTVSMIDAPETDIRNG
jgi:hypothetical protein